VLAAKAANCAGDQGRYWEYHRILFQNQTEWARLNRTLVEEKFLSYAKGLNLNLTSFKDCMQSERYDKEIEKDIADGEKAGVTGTPTIFINGIKVVGAQPVEEFYRIIDRELKSNSQ